MSVPRRSRKRSAIPPAPPADPALDDLLLPLSGPNAFPPDRMTPRERRDEIVALLACGFLRKLRGAPPFDKPAVDDPASPDRPPPRRAT